MGKVNKKEFRKESQSESRLEHLIKKFNITPDDGMLDKTTNLVNHWLRLKDLDGVIGKTLISMTTFTNLMITDPTEQKIYLQWLLQVFVKLIEEDDILARRFIDEDLVATKEYLELFDSNKRKKRFKEWAIKGERRKYFLNNPLKEDSDWVKSNYNPSDINQYKSVNQLFDAVDPFKVRVYSDLEKGMDRFQKMGDGSIEFKDRYWTVFVPYTKSANELFEHVGEWCTAQPGGGMFDTYVVNRKQPNGNNSKIYVILNNKVFTGESDETYQVHFESKQIMDRKNHYSGSGSNLFDLIYSKEGGSNIQEYFHSELDTMAREFKGALDENFYIDYLVSFGYPESLFNYLDDDIKVIKFSGNKKIPRISDLSKFNNLRQLAIVNCDLTELHPSIGKMDKMTTLSLPNNKLETIPKEIGKLTNLLTINLNGNKLKHIPSEIRFLDKRNGGKLFSFNVSEDLLDTELIMKIKELLPSVIINIKDL